jgi:hypothetical protein
MGWQHPGLGRAVPRFGVAASRFGASGATVWEGGITVRGEGSPGLGGRHRGPGRGGPRFGRAASRSGAREATVWGGGIAVRGEGGPGLGRRHRGPGWEITGAVEGRHGAVRGRRGPRRGHQGSGREPRDQAPRPHGDRGRRPGPGQGSTTWRAGPRSPAARPGHASGATIRGHDPTVRRATPRSWGVTPRSPPLPHVSVSRRRTVVVPSLVRQPGTAPSFWRKLAAARRRRQPFVSAGGPSGSRTAEDARRGRIG